MNNNKRNQQTSSVDQNTGKDNTQATTQTGRGNKGTQAGKTGGNQQTSNRDTDSCQ